MERNELLSALKALEPKLSGMNCSVAPTSFDPADPELGAVPRPIGWQWSSCERVLRAHGKRGVMMRLPLFWQLEAPLARAGHAAGIPLFVNEPENMPVAAAVLSTGDVDVVVTEAADAGALSLFLAERGIEPAAATWFLIHQAEALAWHVPQLLKEPSVRVCQEIHMFPGVPILEQCAVLAEKKEPRFHVSDTYRLERGERGAELSQRGEEWSFENYTLPFQVAREGVCRCGAETIARLAV